MANLAQISSMAALLGAQINIFEFLFFNNIEIKPNIV